MHTMRCLVDDDDDLFRSVIEHFVDRHEALVLHASCASAVEAANVLQRRDVDLLFLDVEMPEMTGLELIEGLAQRPQIILVTAKEAYAVEAFDAEVTDYLLKPVTYARFLKAVERAQRKAVLPRPPHPDHVFLKTDGRLVKVDLDAIQWIEAQGDYVMVHTDRQQHLVHSTLKALEEKLPPRDFIRVHRSYIVRIDQISDVEDATLVINRKVIPVGGSYREAFLNRLNTL